VGFFCECGSPFDPATHGPQGIALLGRNCRKEVISEVEYVGGARRAATSEAHGFQRAESGGPGPAERPEITQLSAWMYFLRLVSGSLSYVKKQAPLSLLFCVRVRLYDRARDRLPINLLSVDTCDRIRHGHISLITASTSRHAVYERADPAEAGLQRGPSVCPKPTYERGCLELAFSYALRRTAFTYG